MVKHNSFQLRKKSFFVLLFLKKNLNLSSIHMAVFPIGIYPSENFGTLCPQISQLIKIFHDIMPHKRHFNNLKQIGYSRKRITRLYKQPSHCPNRKTIHIQFYQQHWAQTSNFEQTVQFKLIFA